MLLLCSLRLADETAVLQRQLTQMDLHYIFSQAQLLACLQSALEDIVLEHMLSQGIFVKAVAHVWPSCPFWLAVAL